MLKSFKKFILEGKMETEEELIKKFKSHPWYKNIKTAIKDINHWKQNIPWPPEASTEKWSKDDWQTNISDRVNQNMVPTTGNPFQSNYKKYFKLIDKFVDDLIKKMGKS